MKAQFALTLHEGVVPWREALCKRVHVRCHSGLAACAAKMHEMHGTGQADHVKV